MEDIQLFDTLKIKSKHKEYSLNFVKDFVRHLEIEINEGSFFIIDSKVYNLYLERSFEEVPKSRYIIVEAKESNKTLDKCKDIINYMVSQKVRRNKKLVAIGGGIIQDLTSFTASVLYRGVDWVFFPTTLLSQADSCIGGKTSINLGDRKNIIGNFYPPNKIFIDTSFLRTLPNDDIKSGIGEMLHFYFYSNSNFITELIGNYNKIIDNRKELIKYIQESLTIKKRVIEIDEFDKGERHKFNFGHTFGHALETATNYKIKHGQAVTIGMDIANFISFKLKLISEDEFKRLHKILEINFPNYNWTNFDLDRYIEALSNDKKNIGNKLGCIVYSKPKVLMEMFVTLDAKLLTIIIEYFKET